MTDLGVKIVAILLLAAGAVFGWNWYIDGVRHEADAGGYKRAQDEYAVRENTALKAALADKERLEHELQGVTTDARAKLDAAHADAAAATDAAARLRAALAAARRRPDQCPSAAAGGSAPADPAAGVLADVQRRLDEAADAVARFADASHIAGLACERAADAVK